MSGQNLDIGRRPILMQALVAATAASFWPIDAAAVSSAAFLGRLWVRPYGANEKARQAPLLPVGAPV